MRAVFIDPGLTIGGVTVLGRAFVAPFLATKGPTKLDHVFSDGL